MSIEHDIRNMSTGEKGVVGVFAAAFFPNVVFPAIGAFCAYKGGKALFRGIGKAVTWIGDVVRRRREQLEYEVWERKQPEIKRKAKEEEDRLKDEKRRRHAARAESLLLFNRYELDIQSRFNREQFNLFVQSFLNEASSPEEVERNAALLRDMMQRQFEQVRPARFASPAALIEWFQESLRAIELISDADLRERTKRIFTQRFEDMMHVVSEVRR